MDKLTILEGHVNARISRILFPIFIIAVFLHTIFLAAGLFGWSKPIEMTAIFIALVLYALVAGMGMGLNIHSKAIQRLRTGFPPQG